MRKIRDMRHALGMSQWVVNQEKIVSFPSSHQDKIRKRHHNIGWARIVVAFFIPVLAIFFSLYLHATAKNKILLTVDYTGQPDRTLTNEYAPEP